MKPAKWWQVLIGVVAAAILTTVTIWGVNAYRADQAAQAEADRQAQIAAEQAEFDALVVKFSSPLTVEAAKAPPPATIVEEPVAEEPVYDESVESGPVLCPPGSQANSSDGYNDTSCFPSVCFTISVPNPDYPECDVAFVP